MKPKSYEKSFASYEGLTPTGKKKVDCWSSNNYEWSGEEWNEISV